MHTMPPVRDSGFPPACGDRCNYSIINCQWISSIWVQQSISLLDWIVFCMSIVIYHSVRLASLPLEASCFSYPSGQDQAGTLSVDWYLADKQVVDFIKMGGQGCFQWTPMDDGCSLEFKVCSSSSDLELISQQYYVFSSEHQLCDFEVHQAF